MQGDRQDFFRPFHPTLIHVRTTNCNPASPMFLTQSQTPILPPGTSGSRFFPSLSFDSKRNERNFQILLIFPARIHADSGREKTSYGRGISGQKVNSFWSKTSLLVNSLYPCNFGLMLQDLRMHEEVVVPRTKKQCVSFFLRFNRIFWMTLRLFLTLEFVNKTPRRKRNELQS